MIDNENSVKDLEIQMYETLVPGAKQIKVAALIYDAFCERDDWPPDAEINEALGILISREDIQSFGIITKWRHSEILREI